jgi:hypothetical protein
MPLFDITPNQNPTAPGVLSFGIEGVNPQAFQVDAFGSITAGSITAAGTTDWINVKAAPYNAVGDNATDDTAAIQAAIAAAVPGKVVFFPAGKYWVKSTLVVPSGVTLLGEHANQLGFTNDTAKVKIRAAPTFTGNSLIQLPDLSEEQKLFNLTLDGSLLGASPSVDAIQTVGKVSEFYLNNIGIAFFRHGFNVVTGTGSGGIHFAYSFRLSRISVLNNSGSAFILNSTTDSTFFDLHAEACGDASNPGFKILGASGQSTFVACRAEECYVGYDITDGGELTFLGCSTHRNDRHGFHITSTTSGLTTKGPIQLVGCRLTGDGRNADAGGGGYAGIYVDACSERVVIDGTVVRIENTDQSPQYALRMGSSQFVSYDNCDLWGYTSPVQDDGSNTLVLPGPNLGLRTGTKASPTVNYNNFVIGQTGTLNFGPGGTTNTDTTWGRLSAGVTGSTQALDISGQALGLWVPRNHSLVGWSYSPEAVVAGQTGTAGTVYLAGIQVNRATNVTNIYWGIGIVGVGPTAGQNFVGLFNSAGTLLASTGVDANVTTTDLQTTAISSTAVTPGLYWVAFLFNASTMPGLYRAGFVSGSLVNVGQSAAGYRFATNGTSKTALANITPGSNSRSQNTYWAAIG